MKIKLLLGILVVVLLAACSNPFFPPKKEKGCSHEFTLWQETIAPTCTTAGEETEKCSKCPTLGTAKQEGAVALGHDHFSSLICKRTGCDHQYEIGDTGPGGGIIFYVATTGFTMTDDDSTAYYLEAAPASMPTTLRWSTLTWAEYAASGNDNSLWIDIPGTETAIGTGRKNTALILDIDVTAPAALACDNYFVAGYEDYNDWFLPSKDELNQLYIRRDDVGITSGHFSLWSSSQMDTIHSAWDQDFYIGSQGNLGFKSSQHTARAIRAF